MYPYSNLYFTTKSDAYPLTAQIQFDRGGPPERKNAAKDEIDSGNPFSVTTNLLSFTTNVSSYASLLQLRRYNSTVADHQRGSTQP